MRCIHDSFNGLPISIFRWDKIWCSLRLSLKALNIIVTICSSYSNNKQEYQKYISYLVWLMPRVINWILGVFGLDAEQKEGCFSLHAVCLRPLLDAVPLGFYSEPNQAGFRAFYFTWSYLISKGIKSYLFAGKCVLLISIIYLHLTLFWTLFILS